MKEILLAEKSGFCFGVKRAVDIALNYREKANKNIFTLGQLIHNNDVVELLNSKGIHPIEIDSIDFLHENDIIIIRSHGVSPKIIELLKDKKLIIADATCPYVDHIHKKVKEYYNLSYGIVIVGDFSHPEVIGINGWCNDEAIVSKDGANIEKLPEKICLVSQTTEKQENWEKVLNKVKEKCNEVVSFNTICNATDIRQKSAMELSKNVDTMIVIGGIHSSNTAKLYEICKGNCINTIYVENAGGIPDEIIKNGKRIGITAGASTPDWIIKEAINKMSENKELEFNEQLAYMEQNDVQIAVGDIVKGIIISLNEKEAFVNIGYKTDAVIPLQEATRNDNASINDLFKIGDEIEAKVISLKNNDGYVVLSKVEIEREKAYDEIEQAFENNTTITVEIKEAVKGGIIGRFKGVRIFIPASHIELFHIENLAAYIGKTMEVNVIEYKIQRRGSKIVGSRKAILNKDKLQNEEISWNSLEKGQIVEGQVKRITNFGAFVEVNGIDGLLHVSEISWGRVEKPQDILKVNDIVKVYILQLDKENKKLSLSIKKLIENPWNNIESKYPVGNIVLGKIVRFADFGAFVELEPGVDGLVHISEISYKRINKPNEVLTLGEQVKAKIINVSKEDKKISLSIKETE